MKQLILLVTFCMLILCCKTQQVPDTKVQAKRFSWEDVDKDGLPDGLQLRGKDRENFLKWVCLLAEYQFYKLSPRWQPEQRDCAGLIRFAIREALRRHTKKWLYDIGADPLLATAAPDDPGLELEKLPLGEKIFRTKPNHFQMKDLHDGTLCEFADARTLQAYNCVFVGRDATSARSGDLIFYYDSSAIPSRYHVMLFLGRPHWEDDGHSDWVVYHTGEGSRGMVKKVRLAELAQHPDRRWHPVKNNPCFLGFFRLKIAKG
ncbi:MAG: DUF1175 family protein [Acidobacteriota bacterium]|nr:DUF1175 domain-containing protein [Blastocatellia bacterium]MDW8413320.1 DUF1175 family protein [Acidobacteriota bacterium]